MNADEPTVSSGARNRVGVVLRQLAGVQEPVINLVPGERARYASMGGVVLGTAAIAAVSMAVAMYAVFGASSNPVAIVFTAVFTALWGLFILNLDRWLMSTTIDRDGLARFVRFLPRIGLAVIFGVIIAEPLLLGVYNSAIEKRVHNERAGEVARLEAALIRCNPESGPAGRPPDCADDSLTVDVDPDATRTQLDTRLRQADELRNKVARDQARYKELTDAARRECAGDSGRGLTGRPGMGPRCTELYRRANEHYRDNGMAHDAERLRRLDDEVAELSGRLRNESAAYAARINARIQERVRDSRAVQQEIGLLERLRALDSLVSENGYVRASEWALRIFFIVVDSLPVLVKMLTGRTAYDRISAGRLAREERAQQFAEGTAGYRDAVQAGVRRYQIDLDGAAERDKASVRAQHARTNTDKELRRFEEVRAGEILTQTRGLRRPVSRNNSHGDP